MCEHRLDLVGLENRSRLVEQNDWLMMGALLDGEDLCKLDHLAFGEGERVGLRSRGYLRAEFVELGRRKLVEPVPLVKSVADSRALVTEQDILGHGDVG